MKAHAVEKSDIILSIGMIVKNEEKVLERCLKSMQPLMKAIPCELIIADTGSTDSTVEIAKKYTDNVFYFEWINDFAAARNSTLEKAKGQWYMFIDADEYFDEDISELVDFFTISELRNKYKTLQITVRSYLDSEMSAYSDVSLARFQKINDPNDPIYFIGSIHESMWIRQPLCYCTTIIHHTGYCFFSDQQHLNKKTRNLNLMREEYKKNPTDLRLLSHIIDGTVFELKEREKYIDEALSLAREKRNDFYANAIFMQAATFLQNQRPEFALELCEEYYNTLDEPDKYIATLAVVLVKAKILSGLARDEDAIKSFYKYFELYRLYKEEKLNLTDLSAHPIEGITEEEFIKYNCMASLVLKRLHRYDEAFDLLGQFEVNELKPDNFKEVLGTIRELSQDMCKYDTLSYYYEHVMKSKDENQRQLALYMMESTYYSIVGEEKRKQFANDVVESGVEGRFCELMKLVLSQNEPDFKERLAYFISSVDTWKDGYNEVVYLAVKHGLDISETIDKMEPSNFRIKLEKVANNHDDFAELVIDYGVPEGFTQNIKRFYWITSLIEKASYRSFNLDDSKKYELYMRFTNILGEYVSNIYNPELLEDEADVEILPPLHRFGYYMLKANKALEENNSIEYVRGLKKALTSCESMKEIIEFLLKQFKKTLK